MRRLVVIALLLSSGRALADAQSDADQLTREAIALGKSGNLEQAVDRFKAAQKRFPRPNNHCNIGLAYAQLERWARANLYLERCKSQVRAGLPEWVDKRLKQSSDGLKAALYAPVEVSSEPPGARLLAPGYDEEDALVTPVVVWLPLGERELQAELTGYLVLRHSLKLDDVRSRAVKLVLEVNAPPPEPPRSPAPMVVAPEVVMAAPAPPKPSRLRLAGGVTLGIGVAALGIALTLYLVARDVTTPEANGLGRDTPAFNDAIDRFHGQYYSSIALLAVGGALTVGGVAVLAASAKKKR